MKDILWKCFKFLLLEVLAVVMMDGGQVLGYGISMPLMTSSDSTLVFADMYFAFIGVWILTLGYCLLIKKNRKYFAYLGKGGRGNNIKTILGIGLPCGLGINLLIGLIAIAHGDIKLYFAEINLPLLLLFLVTVTIQCGAEEVVWRWFIYQKMRELFPNLPLFPVVITAVSFSLGHLRNPGVTILSLSNIVLAGVLYALIIYYFDSFWACVVAHTGWNFCQSIILGLPNSGIVSSYSIFRLDAATAENSFAYNTGFGIEGTVMSSLLLFIAVVIIVFIGRKKKLTNACVPEV